MASMYEVTVPALARQLKGLATVLKKAQALYGEKKLDETTLLNYRLYPDMFNFARQVQATTDHARSCVAMLAGQEPPKYEANEKSLADLIARVERTMSYLSEFKPAQLDGTEAKTITMKMGEREMQMTGLDLVINRSLPNFYFHNTTAYDILRHNGVEIGKRDFLGAT